MFTALDAQRRGTNFLGGNADDSTPGNSTLRAVREAIKDALEELGACYDWSYLIDEEALLLPAPYETGTIAYTASTRTLTLTSGTWPTWAVYGVVKISNAHARVERRVSSSVLILESLTAPSEDIASGTSYVLYRDQLPLPEGTVAVAAPSVDGKDWELTWVEPTAWYRVVPSQSLEGAGMPRWYTVQADPDIPGNSALVVAPRPDQAYTLRFMRRRSPRPIRFWEITAGTVAVTSAGSTVTGTGTSFTAAMVGSIIRLSDDANNLPDPSGDEYPAEEAVVKVYTSGTSVDIFGSFTQSLSGVRYVISDPIDIDMVTMSAAFHSMILRNLARFQTHKAENRDRFEKDAKDDLRDAKGRDSRSFQPKYVGSGITERIWSWRRWR